MKYLQAAIDLGHPADCATNGRSYDDLIRTWNRAYKRVPKRQQLEQRIEQAMSTVAVSVKPTTQKPRKKWFFGLF